MVHLKLHGIIYFILQLERKINESENDTQN